MPDYSSFLAQRKSEAIVGTLYGSGNAKSINESIKKRLKFRGTQAVTTSGGGGGGGGSFPPPTNFDVINGGLGQDVIAVSWVLPVYTQSSGPPTGYQVSIKPAVSSAGEFYDTVDTSYTFMNLSPSTEYILSVRAVYSSGSSAFVLLPNGSVTTTTGGPN